MLFLIILKDTYLFAYFTISRDRARTINKL